MMPELHPQERAWVAVVGIRGMVVIAQTLQPGSAGMGKRERVMNKVK